MYGIFGFSFGMRLSTRPDKYVGEIETWNRAEESLKKALDTMNKSWEVNPGDGTCITTSSRRRNKY